MFRRHALTELSRSFMAWHYIVARHKPSGWREPRLFLPLCLAAALTSIVQDGIPARGKEQDSGRA